MGFSVMGAGPALEAAAGAMLRRGAPAECGLLVGKPGVGSRTLLLAVAPAPPGDAPCWRGGGAGTGGGKGRGGKGAPGGGGVSLALDCEWAQLHARQLGAMLPGGLEVVGAYLFCSEAVLRAGNHAAQAGTLARAAVAGGLEADGTGGAGAAHPAVLLHVDAEGRGKLACRKCPAGAGGGGSGRPEPCELKLGPVAAGLIELRTSYALSALPTAAVAPGAPGAAAALAAAAGAAAARERAALSPPGALFLEAAGAVLDPGASLVEALARVGSATGGGAAGGAAVAGHHEVIVLRGPGASARPGAAGGALPVSVRCRPAGGRIRGVAFAWGREPAARAARELAQDLVRSLGAREELLLADADAVADETRAEPPPPAAPALRFALPRRCALWGPWLTGGVAASDYLAEGEGVSAAAGRCAELWGAPPHEDGGAEEWEAEAAASGPAAAPWDPAGAPPVGGGGSAVAGAAAAAFPSGPSCAALAAAGASAGLAALLAALHWGAQAPEL